MRGRIVLLVALAGCDLVFPISGSGDPPADALPDAPPGFVIGTLQRAFVTNKDDGTPVTAKEPLVASLALMARHEDGTRVSLDIDADGAFIFAAPVEGGRYALELPIDGATREIQSNSTRLDVVWPSLGRPNRAQPTMLTDVKLQPAEVANGEPYLASSGVWTATRPPKLVGDAAIGYTVDWRAVDSLSGPVGLVDGTQHDKLFYVEFRLAATVSGGQFYQLASAVETASPMMVDGQQVTIATPTTILADRCATISANRVAQGNRMTVAQPRYQDVFADFSIDAIPDRALGPLGALQIAAQGDVVTNITNLALRFANPYGVGQQLVASFAVARTRPLARPGSQETTAVFATRHTDLLDPIDDCAGNLALLNGTIGLPNASTFMLDGMPLSDDDTAQVVKGTRDLVATWSLVDNTVDWYSIVFAEVIDIGGMTSFRSIRELRTMEPRVAIDPGLLEPGSFYVLNISGRRGYPMATSGNFAGATYPNETFILFSPMFRVVASAN